MAGGKAVFPFSGGPVKSGPRPLIMCRKSGLENRDLSENVTIPTYNVGKSTVWKVEISLFPFPEK